MHDPRSYNIEFGRHQQNGEQLDTFPRFIGMVHLPPLPGAPLSRLSVAECEAYALRDTASLVKGGADALIVENYGDTPFRGSRVDAHTIAVMTRITAAIRKNVSIPIGVNVLRNDAAAALGIAVACDAQFIRVNVHTGTMVTDQGIVSGEPDRTMRLRRELNAGHILVFADVLVKHGSPLGVLSVGDAVEDAIHRGLADGVIVSGSATGKPTGLTDVQEAVSAAGDVPVYVGSGATIDSIHTLIPPAYGAIVGTGLKNGGRVEAPVDASSVREFARRIAAGAM